MLEVAGHMPLTMQSDSKMKRNNAHVELLKRIAQDADKSAFTELFADFGPMIKGFMMRNGATPELAEDLAQDTLIKVWRKASLYSPGKGSVSTWIFTIARNLRIDTFRRARGVKFEEISNFDFESSDPSGEESAIGLQESVTVADAVKALPAEQREVVQLAFRDHLTHMEIAEKLDLPLGTVKSRMRLAYNKLSTALEDLR
jgi:RNA polymerase sigma-70 factor (ECF subfamily)